MNHFELQGGELACEGVSLPLIAEAVGTPVYVYSSATLERHYQVLRDALVAAGLGQPLIAFAVKANSNVAVLKTLARLGCGADVVSEGEIRRALTAGVPPGRIVYSGVGKTEAEIAFALKTGVAELNVARSGGERDRATLLERTAGRHEPCARRLGYISLAIGHGLTGCWLPPLRVRIGRGRCGTRSSRSATLPR